MDTDSSACSVQDDKIIITYNTMHEPAKDSRLNHQRSDQSMRMQSIISAERHSCTDAKVIGLTEGNGVACISQARLPLA